MDIRERRRMAGIYLKALFAPYETGYIEIRALRAGRPLQEWFWIPNLRGQGFQSSVQGGAYLAQIADYGLRLSDDGYDVYCGVLPRGQWHKAHKSDIYHAGYAWADMDFKDVPEEDARKATEDAAILVHSGGGLHAYWPVAPVVSLTSAAMERFEKALHAHQGKIGADATQDVTRILRLPGGWNWKNKKEPRPVVLERCEPK